MTSAPSHRDRPTHRIAGPDELVQAVPYLLRFHPYVSLVLVGLRAGRVVVTARLDLDEDERALLIGETMATLQRAEADSLVAVVYPDAAGEHHDVSDGSVPITVVPGLAAVAAEIRDSAERFGHALLDLICVRRGRWWSLDCPDRRCCPAGGNPVPAAPSSFATAATVDGVVALPDRAALESTFAPYPPARRAALEPAIAEHEHAGVSALLAGRGAAHERAAKRALFAAARASDEPGWTPPDDGQLARFGVALSDRAVREATWLAVDDARLDGRALWRELGRRLPAPYAAAPLLLLGWRHWRDGDGAAAAIAAQRSRDESTPPFEPAELLLAVLTQGLDPRRVPRLSTGLRRRS